MYQREIGLLLRVYVLARVINLFYFLFLNALDQYVQHKRNDQYILKNYTIVPSSLGGTDGLVEMLNLGVLDSFDRLAVGIRLNQTFPV